MIAQTPRIDQRLRSFPAKKLTGAIILSAASNKRLPAQIRFAGAAALKHFKCENIQTSGHCPTQTALFKSLSGHDIISVK